MLHDVHCLTLGRGSATFRPWLPQTQQQQALSSALEEDPEPRPTKPITLPFLLPLKKLHAFLNRRCRIKPPKCFLLKPGPLPFRILPIPPFHPFPAFLHPDF